VRSSEKPHSEPPVASRRIEKEGRGQKRGPTTLLLSSLPCMYAPIKAPPKRPDMGVKTDMLALMSYATNRIE
jgi:hypothetical protein